MCGLLGYWSERFSPQEVFEKQLSKLRHRGPDYTGIRYEGRLVLGHTRLAIIDLDAASNQPMTSNCGKISIVFNGEIYNFLELRSELSDYQFTTNSDTEVIIAAYLKWGKDFVKKLNGMFSLAIHDLEQNALFFARDPIGKKPLYYSHNSKCFAFASEIKALIGLPGVDTELNSLAANEYFSLGYIGNNRTVFESISQLPAGHSAFFSFDSPSELKIERYWHLSVTKGDVSRNEDNFLEEIDELLVDAVRIRMRSDVPLGAFLSGGLDSSLIVALAAKISSQPLNTFTISFPGMSNDEAIYAKKIAAYFGTNHVVHEVHEDMLDDLPGLISQLDQPFADSSIVPTSLICREARKDVTVALSGDGGDELFAGYGHYDYFAWEDNIRKSWPPILRKTMGRVASVLPERHKTRMIKRLAIDDQYNSMGAYASRFFDFEEREKLFAGPLKADPFPELEYQSHFLDGIDWLQNICQADFQDYMVDDILVKVDRMSMLHSLEVRSPLLDKRIAEVVFSKIPSDLKRHGTIKKYLLKKLAHRYLPKDFEFERKAGFGVPLGQWFDSVLGERLLSLLDSSPSGCIDTNVARHYLKLHKRGFSNYSKKLFAILVWEEWFATHKEVC